MALSAFMKRISFLAAVALSALVLTNATQVMRRPETFKDAPRKLPTSKVEPQVIHKRAGSKVQAAYFTNWGIYGANFQPTDIIPSTLTHIVYAFADVSADTGSIVLTDSYADEQKHFPGDSWDDPGNNLYGCLKQMYLLKLKNRNLKVLLSIGGWTYSQSGHFNFVTDANKRATFVTSAVSMIENYGFDGIDIDFEYPTSGPLASGFADLLTSLRTAFDNLQKQKGDSVPYQLTAMRISQAAVPAGSDNYAFLRVPEMNSALTYWNLMAYDYAGSWLTFSSHKPIANLYGGERTNVSTDKAVKWYIQNGASANKINMGIPLYGRAFEQTTGIGAPYTGIGPGTTEAGIYSYKDLPLAGAKVFENLTDVTSYSFDSSKGELVSYDTPHIATIKAQYVQNNGLAGSMFWDLSTDKVGADSLVGTTAGVYGSLDQTQNHINFPNSKWDNIRNNMGTSPGSPGSSSAPANPTTTTPSRTTTSPTTAPTGGSGKCASVAAWSAGATYTGGQQATYQGHLWTAKWWTSNDIPGGAAGVWTDNGAC
ncbi:glycosyl hydrolases family 18-domain-containing protein [Trametes polyzona]|nr:glycosyl hydrolases family 18-domain-containing protein [Trametes polyzona]